MWVQNFDKNCFEKKVLFTKHWQQQQQQQHYKTLRKTLINSKESCKIKLLRLIK